MEKAEKTPHHMIEKNDAVPILMKESKPRIAQSNQTRDRRRTGEACRIFFVTRSRALSFISMIQSIKQLCITTFNQKHKQKWRT